MRCVSSPRVAAVKTEFPDRKDTGEGSFTPEWPVNVDSVVSECSQRVRLSLLIGIALFNVSLLVFRY